MIQFEVKPQGFDRVRAWIKRGVNLDDAIGRGLGEWAQDHLDGKLYGMENYAPPPPNSKYVRTGTLGRGWGLMRRGKTGVRFFNMTPYAGYVVGDGNAKRQAAIHAGRWWLARKRTEAALPEAKERIRKHISKALR